MAEQADDNEAIVKDVAMIIVCPICMDLLTDSRILRCGHTFCSACVNALTNATMPAQVLCPVCRAPILAIINRPTRSLLLDQVADRLRGQALPQPHPQPHPQPQAHPQPQPHPQPPVGVPAVNVAGPNAAAVDPEPGGFGVFELLNLIIRVLIYVLILIAVVIKLSEVCEGLQSDDSVYSTGFTRLVRRTVLPEPEPEPEPAPETGFMAFLRRLLLAEPVQPQCPTLGPWEKLADAFANYLMGLTKGK